MCKVLFLFIGTVLLSGCNPWGIKKGKVGKYKVYVDQRNMKCNVLLDSMDYNNYVLIVDEGLDGTPDNKSFVRVGRGHGVVHSLPLTQKDSFLFQDIKNRFY